LTNPAIAKGAGVKSADDAVTALFEQRLCEWKIQQKADAFRAQGIAPGDDVVLSGETINTGLMVGRAAGTQRDPKLCGVVGVKKGTGA
jgi:hypothetical protein